MPGALQPRTAGSSRRLWTGGISEGVDRSGDVSSGRGEPFTARVDQVLQHDADVIVVAGGVGPVANDEITNAAEDVALPVGRGVVQRVRGRRAVAVLQRGAGSVYAGVRRKPAEDRAAAQLAVRRRDRVASRGHGVFGSDTYHPTDKGQRQVAERMEEALAALGLTDTSKANGD